MVIDRERSTEALYESTKIHPRVANRGRYGRHGFHKSSFRHFGTRHAKPEAGHERRGQRNKKCGQRHWKGNEESREEDGKRHQESDEQNGAENKRRLAKG